MDLRSILTLPDANSRLVFLSQGAAVAASILILTVSFVHQEGAVRDGDVEMMMVLLGGGSVTTLARGASKKLGQEGAAKTTPSEDKLL